MGGSGAVLAAHCVYILVIAAWVCGIMTPFFLLLNRLGLMRVPAGELAHAPLDARRIGPGGPAAVACAPAAARLDIAPARRGLRRCTCPARPRVAPTCYHGAE